MGHTILSKYQQKLILTEPQRRETLTSSYVSPLALSSTRKAHWYHSAKNPAKLRPQTPISPPDLSATRSTAPPQQEEFKNQTLKITKQIKQPQIHTLLKDVIGGVELSEAATGKAATRVLVAKFLR